MGSYFENVIRYVVIPTSYLLAIYPLMLPPTLAHWEIFFNSPKSVPNKSVISASAIQYSTKIPNTSQQNILTPLKQNVTTIFKSPIIIQKHELEGEYIPENSTVSSACVSSTPTSNTGQEIDETRLADCSPATPQSVINQTITAITSTSIPGTFSSTTTSTSNISNNSTSTSEISTPITQTSPTSVSVNITNKPTTPFPGLEIDETKNNEKDLEETLKFWSHLSEEIEKPTITVTKTFIKSVTEMVTINPSCLQLHDVTGLCEGVIKIIRPTSTILESAPTRNTYEISDPVLVMEFENQHIKKKIVKPVSTSTVSSYSPQKIASQSSDNDILDASVFDYDVEEVPHEHMIKAATSTPVLNRLPDRLHKRSTSVNVLLNLLSSLKPDIKVINSYVSTTIMKYTTDFSVTATIIASRCVPRDINLPTCSETSSSIPVLPLVRTFGHT